MLQGLRGLKDQQVTKVLKEQWDSKVLKGYQDLMVIRERKGLNQVPKVHKEH